MKEKKNPFSPQRLLPPPFYQISFPSFSLPLFLLPHLLLLFQAIVAASLSSARLPTVTNLYLCPSSSSPRAGTTARCRQIIIIIIIIIIMEEEPQAVEASPPPGNLPSSAISPPRSPPIVAAASPPPSSPSTTALAPATPWLLHPDPLAVFQICVSRRNLIFSGSPTAPATFPAGSGLRRLPCQIRISAALLHATGRTVEHDVSTLASETRRDMLNTNLAHLGVAPLGLGAWMPCSLHPSPPPGARRRPPATRHEFAIAAHDGGSPSATPLVVAT